MKKLLNTLYVTSEDAWLHKDGQNVVVKIDGTERGRAPAHLLSQIVCFGHVGVTLHRSERRCCSFDHKSAEVRRIIQVFAGF